MRLNVLLAVVVLVAVVSCGDDGGTKLPGSAVDPNTPDTNVFKPPTGEPKAGPCQPDGASAECFEADPALLGVGECASGVQFCHDGEWSECGGQVLPVEEYCDFRDNDCDGKMDEGVQSSCGNCNPHCTQEAAGPNTSDPLVIGENNSKNAILTEEGWVTLTMTSVNLNVIWVANSGENTVSKLNTNTGYEMGRYQVCTDPSRTAVGKYGEGWVACRSNNGTVARIFNFEGDCEDKNGNGTIETSKDLNNDHVISGEELLPQGEDECVHWVVQTANVPANPTSATKARAMGVDFDGNGWMGLWESQQLVKLNQNDGSIMQVISIPQNPYGLVIGKDNVIWVAGRGGKRLTRVDPNTNQVGSLYPGNYPNGSYYNPYGITMDELGRIWTAQLGDGPYLVWMYDPQNNVWQSIPVPSRPRGLVANGQGRIFVACDESNVVAVINNQTMQHTDSINLGNGHFPIGMAVDAKGFIWAVNHTSGSIHKIDGNSLAIIGNFPVGNNPYTYSDMTGTAFFDVIPPGFYRHRFTGNPKGGLTGLGAMNNLLWAGLIVKAATPSNSHVKVRLRTGNDPVALDSQPWTPFIGPFPPELFPIDLSQYFEAPADFLDVEVWLYPSDENHMPVLKGLDVQYEAVP